MEYGLTEKGFVAKPFAVILEEERQAWKTSFGFEIDTSTETPEGAYIGNQAAKFNQIWEMMEGLYAIGDPDSASGIYLDRLCTLVNVERKAAEATRVYAALWGEEGTPIGVGHLTRMVTGEQFALQGSITIDRSRLLGFQFKISELKIASYSFSINGRIISYIATIDDTKETVQAGLFDRIEAILPGIYVASNSGDDGMEIYAADGIVPFVLFCDDPKIEIVTLGALGIYRATVAGTIFVGIGTLNTIVSNVNGLNRIINYATGITGRAVESDAELRIDKSNRQRQASGNELAIQKEIEKVPGVLYCRVYSNRTMEENNERPPKSYEAIVIGGMDNEIAETILDKGPAGIEPFGNTIVQVNDNAGMLWDIGFSRPKNRYIWIKIVIEKNLEEDFPANGIELIKNNIDIWGAEEMGVGINLIYQRLNIPVYKVSGIGFAEIKIAVTEDLVQPDELAYTAQNVEISEREIALIDKTRVIIEEQEPEEP